MQSAHSLLFIQADSFQHGCSPHYDEACCWEPDVKPVAKQSYYGRGGMMLAFPCNYVHLQRWIQGKGSVLALFAYNTNPHRSFQMRKRGRPVGESIEAGLGPSVLVALLPLRVAGEGRAPEELQRLRLGWQLRPLSREPERAGVHTGGLGRAVAAPLRHPGERARIRPQPLRRTAEGNGESLLSLLLVQFVVANPPQACVRSDTFSTCPCSSNTVPQSWSTSQSSSTPQPSAASQSTYASQSYASQSTALPQSTPPPSDIYLNTGADSSTTLQKAAASSAMPYHTSLLLLCAVLAVFL